MAPPREDLKKRIFVPNLVKPPQKTGANDVQGATPSNPPSGDVSTPSQKTLKGRIKINQLETEKINRILEEKKYPVNMKLTKDGSTMISCVAEQRLDVIKVLKDNGQMGHSFMTREDRYIVKMLKGIDYSFGPQRVADEILEKLADKGLKKEDFHVDRFETFHSVTSDKRYHMYVVKADNTDVMNMITSIFGLCNMVCKWENMYKRTVTQCFNCFEFGHSQMGGCFKPRKCKRCNVVESNHVCTIELVTPTEENGYNPYLNCICCNCNHPRTQSVRSM